jgi:hypothetical protein
MHIVAAGVSGFLGTRLTTTLAAEGHRVTRLVRSAPAGPGQSVWNPDAGTVDDAVFDGADAVVNLCGVGVGDKRWNEEYKRLIISSRVNPTSLLAAKAAQHRVPVLINASGVGYYGALGDEIVTEDFPAGDSFLARTCVQWEGATEAARSGGVRVVNLRTGLVLGKDGGLLPKLTLLTRLMLGGKLGSGKQYFPWISVTDEIRAMLHLLTAPVDGPVNLTGPYPVTNAEFTKELGRALHRPAPWIVPGFALKVVLGEFAEEVLGGQRAVPTKLHDSGFEFAHRQLPEALAAELA